MKTDIESKSLINKDEIYYRIIYESNLPFLKLNLNFPHSNILNELKLLKNSVKQCDNSKWEGLTLHGLGSKNPRPAHFYGYDNEEEAPYKWTKEGFSCVDTKHYIESNFYSERYCRIKAHVLKPGGKIHRHFDSNLQGLGVIDHKKNYKNTHKVKYLTFAIDWEREVSFFVNDQKIPITTGDIYLINFSMPHHVVHEGKRDRYSLIVSGEFDKYEYWKDLVISSYNCFINSNNYQNNTL